VTAAGRLEWEPTDNLILAAHASGGRLSSRDNDPENGLTGRAPWGYRFFQDVYVQGLDYEDLPPVMGIGTNFTARWRFARGRDIVFGHDYMTFDDLGPKTIADSVRPRASDIRPVGSTQQPWGDPGVWPRGCVSWGTRAQNGSPSQGLLRTPRRSEPTS
jgi:hypothetical protein